MKKIILLAATLLLSLNTFAAPVIPGRKVVYTQPDGSTITLFAHGDEYFHYVTDDAGNIMKKGTDGFYHTVEKTAATWTTSLQRATTRRSQAMATVKAKAASANHTGSPKIPVFLIGFDGTPFTKTAEEFDAMLNSPGYNANGAVGSVLDYYRDNSFGSFTPQFEVLGPVNLNHELAYYGENISTDDDAEDMQPELALIHAAQKLDASVDFSRYDNDGDGTVDFVLFYYAGFDEAQTWPSGTDNIWSHAWYLSSSSVSLSDRTFDNVKLDRYFCTSELKGESGTTMCSIGTTVHEFAHTLGLPDFYDTNYATNGSAGGTYVYDVMCDGSYNSNMVRPPYFTAEELMEIGWLNSIPEITVTSGTLTIEAINYPGASQYTAYKTETGVTNEYFIYEVRRGEGWDTGLQPGMLVYHVDKSSNRVSGSVRASSLWSSNEVNIYSSHPCCYIVPAAAQTSYNYTGSSANIPFPGNSGKTTYTPTAWNGNDIGFTFKNIAYANGVVTMTVANSNEMGIMGVVSDTDGNPIAGATVTVQLQETTAGVSAKGKVSDLLKKAPRMKAPAGTVATTDDSGAYSIDLTSSGSYLVSVSCDGYVSKTATVEVSRLVEKNFTLLREGESLPSELYTFPEGTEDDDWYSYGDTDYDEWDMMVADIFPASRFGEYAGKQIKTISFMLSGNAVSDVYAIVDFGSERKLAIPVKEPVLNEWITVDVKDYELVFPEGEDVYVGYAAKWTDSNYPLKAIETEDADLIVYLADYDLDTVAWEANEGVVAAIKMTVGDYRPSDTGYNFIEDPQNGDYSAGDIFYLNLVETEGDRKPDSDIVWYFDDEPVSGSVRLTAGSHMVEARFTTVAGTKKVVELELDVK